MRIAKKQTDNFFTKYKVREPFVKHSVSSRKNTREYIKLEILNRRENYKYRYGNVAEKDWK